VITKFRKEVVYMSGIIKYFREFIEGRSEEMCVALGKNNKEYKELCIKSSDLQKKIIDALGDEQISVFFEYEDIVNAQAGIIKEELYKAGFIDGIKVAKLIDKI